MDKFLLGILNIHFNSEDFLNYLSHHGPQGITKGGTNDKNVCQCQSCNCPDLCTGV